MLTYVPNTILGASHKFSLILTTTLGGTYSHFIDGETTAQVGWEIWSSVHNKWSGRTKMDWHRQLLASVLALFTHINASSAAAILNWHLLCLPYLRIPIIKQLRCWRPTGKFTSGFVAKLSVTLHKHTRAIHIPNFDKLRGGEHHNLLTN